MAKMGDLSVRLTADTKDYNRKMDEARKKTQTFGNKASESFHKMGKAVDSARNAVSALAGAMAIRAMTSYIKGALDSAEQIRNLARLAGIGTEEFQRQAFAAKQVGIQQEKLADIYKDVNDKLGDYITTGQGPLVDFFDVVGKKVGVTVKDFQNLTSDQILGKYIDTLQRANISQQEMTFYLEAIASDATGLAPLFANNAEKLREYGEAAKDVISDDQIQKIEEVNRKFSALAETIGNKLKSAIVDAATVWAEWLNLTDSAKLRDEIKSIDKEMGELFDDIEKGKKAAQGTSLGGALGIGPEGIRVNQSDEERIATEQKLNELLEKRRELQKELDALQFSPSDSGGTNTGGGKTPEELQKELDAEAEAVRLSKEQWTLYNDAKGAALNATAGTTQEEADAVWEQIKAEQEFIETLEEKVEMHKKYGGELTKEQEMLVKIGELMEKFPEKQELLAEAYRLTAEEIAAMADEGEEAIDQMSIFAEQAARNMQDAFTDFLIDPTKDGFDGLLKNFSDMLKKMVAEVLAQKILTSLFGGLAGSDNGFLSAIGKAFTPSGSAGGGIIQPGRLALVGERGPELIMPNAPARVVNNHAMGSMMGGSSNVVVQIKNDGTPQRITNSTATQRGDKMIISVLTQDIETGGPFTRKLQSSFDGLRRTG